MRFSYTLTPERGPKIFSRINYQRKDVAIRLGQAFATMLSRNENMDVKLEVFRASFQPCCSSRLVYEETISYLALENKPY